MKKPHKNNQQSPEERARGSFIRGTGKLPKKSKVIHVVSPKIDRSLEILMNNSSHCALEIWHKTQKKISNLI